MQRTHRSLFALVAALAAVGGGAPAAAGGLLPRPPEDPALAAMLPTVAGYSLMPVPVDDTVRGVYGLPDDFAFADRTVVAADGTEVGRVIVASSAPGPVSAIDAYVEVAFTDYVLFPTSVTSTGDATSMTVDAVLPDWVELAGAAVMYAEQPGGQAAQWAWSALDRVWIVRGTPAAQAYVLALLAQQVPTLSPFDQQGLTGDLFDHTPTVFGYVYHDSPRDYTLDNLQYAPLPDLDCLERFYLGVVAPSNTTQTTFGEGDLVLVLAEAAGACVSEGFLVAIDSALTEGLGPQSDVIAGVPVHRTANNIAFRIGDVVVQLTSTDPAAFVGRDAFITAFVKGQPVA